MLNNSLSPRLLKGLDVYFPNFGFRNSDFEFATRWAFFSSLVDLPSPSSFGARVPFGFAGVFPGSLSGDPGHLEDVIAP